MRLAREIATWSKDPSTQVASIAVDDNRRILSTGYNGFPAGLKDDSRLYNRDEKYRYIVHSEMNCIYNAVNNGVSLKGSTIYVYGLPVCSRCMSGILSVGIKRIVYYTDGIPYANKWSEEFHTTINICMEANIELQRVIAL